MIYFTSDMHFWTPNILEFADRPFATIEEMQEVIAERWHARVKPKDTVFVLGDQGFPTDYPDAEARLLNFMNSLPGTKYLIRGNHDTWAYHNEPLAKQVYKEVLDLMLIIAGHYGIALCHYPLEQWLRCNLGAVHIHGHIHSSKFCSPEHNTFYQNIPGRLCCCVDMCGWEPKTLLELQQLQQPNVPLQRIDDEYLTRFIYKFPEEELLG